MNLIQVIFLALVLVSCGDKPLMEIDGVGSSLEKMGESLTRGLGLEELKTSTITRPNLKINGVQKIFEANVDSLKSLTITVINPREDIGVNGITGRPHQLGSSHFGQSLSWQDLGLKVAYENSELLPDVESVKENRDPKTGVLSSVVITYTVDGNVEGLLQILIGNDFTGRKLSNVQRVLVADVTLKIKSKTDLNTNQKLGGF